MTPIPVDLTEVEAWSGAGILPPGTHVCRIEDAEEGESSGGHPQIQLDLRAITGEHEGGTIRDWIVVIPATLGKVRAVLEAADVEIPEGAFELDASVFVGRLVRIVVREEPSPDGTRRARVKAYERPDGAELRSDVPADMSGLPGNGQAKGDDRIPF